MKDQEVPEGFDPLANLSPARRREHERFWWHFAAFTQSSAFHGVIQDWPDIRDANSFYLHGNENFGWGLNDDELLSVMYDFVHAGLYVLEHEVETPYVRLTASRLANIIDSNEFIIHITSHVYDNIKPQTDPFLSKEYAIVVAPGRLYNDTTIYIPTKWFEAAVTQPILALSALLRAGAYARDHHFGVLTGGHWIGSKEIPEPVVVTPNSLTTKHRADLLVTEMLLEAYYLDQNKAHIGLHIDNDHWQLIRSYLWPRSQVPDWLYYPDPDTRES